VVARVLETEKRRMTNCPRAHPLSHGPFPLTRGEVRMGVGAHPTAVTARAITSTNDHMEAR